MDFAAIEKANPTYFLSPTPGLTIRARLEPYPDLDNAVLLITSERWASGSRGMRRVFEVNPLTLRMYFRAHLYGR